MKIKRYNNLSIKKQEGITGYLFITPFLIGFIVFQGIPFISAMFISMTDIRFSTNFSKIKFIGFDNFIRLVSDQTFIQSFGRTIFYSVLYVPSIIILGLLFACIVNGKIFARNFIRTSIFMPYVSNMVAIAIIWSLLLDYKDGPVNMFLKSIGVENPPMWLLGNMGDVIPTIVIIVCWQAIGFYMITFLAALQGIPSTLLEAADLDGASRFQKFYHITLPIISPTTFFLLINAILSSFHNFGIIRVLTKGGPGSSSRVLSINIYEEAFNYSRIGYATSQSMVLLLLILAITLFQWKYQKKWVNY